MEGEVWQDAARSAVPEPPQPLPGPALLCSRLVIVLPSRAECGVLGGIAGYKGRDFSRAECDVRRLQPAEPGLGLGEMASGGGQSAQLSGEQL